ncbi:MAG: VTT domain-containing protein [Ferruginibacter sp.]|nr:VTT domain-containing protein [Ferruginibacter sp.]
MFGASAQDSIRVNLLNQYKQQVADATIDVNNVIYTSGKDGSVSILAAGTDSITITKEGYSVQRASVNEIRQGKEVLMNKEFSWTDLLTPMFYILYGGIWLLLIIIFAETGLFIGFFFPGDSLLFVAGILSTPLVDSISLNTGNDFFNLLIISGMCIIAGVLGNTVGYMTGRKVGPAMFNWKDRLLFKKKYLYQAKDFYEKHGGGAIVFARFLPFIRTFAPIVAGIVNMDKKKFSFYNIIGCIAWVTSMLFIGHYLNAFTKQQFGLDLEKHLEIIVIGIVLVTTAPVFIKLFFGKKKTQPST